MRIAVEILLVMYFYYAKKVLTIATESNPTIIVTLKIILNTYKKEEPFNL